MKAVKELSTHRAPKPTELGSWAVLLAFWEWRWGCCWLSRSGPESSLLATSISISLVLSSFELLAWEPRWGEKGVVGKGVSQVGWLVDFGLFNYQSLIDVKADLVACALKSQHWQVVTEKSGVCHPQ